MRPINVWVFCSPTWEAHRGRYRSLVYRDDGTSYGFAVYGPRPDYDAYRESHHAVQASRDALLTAARQIVDQLNHW